MTPIERAWRGTKNDWRLHALSVFSVAVAFVCLASALLVVVNVSHVRDRWASTGRASVYLKKGADREQIATIERALRASTGVSDVKYVSSEDARHDMTGQSDDPIIDALPTEAFPASIEVMVQSEVAAGRLDQLASQLGALPAVERVETYAAWSDRLASLLAGGVTASGLLALVVLAAVISVVSSTIRLALQRRRIEVEVLKLVGATDDYVRRPYVVEGAVQGALGATLALLLLGSLFAIVQSHFDSSFATLIGMTPSFLPWSVAVGLVGAGAVLGALAALLSVRRLLSV
ncbi:MAG TPA: permease-like cell division protein FtsX [Polyangiaceae bacterium]|jgi:cell division transport system permease protein|nr:permease-like cell division protein FtsX [Polyangiaceae bacterium]